MRLNEHAELHYLQRQRPRGVTKPDEIAEICTRCVGACKAKKGLSVCGRQAREKAKRC